MRAMASRLVLATMILTGLPDGAAMAADDLTAVRAELQRLFPASVLDRPVAPAPFQMLGRTDPFAEVYRRTASGVVIIGLRDALLAGAGILVSKDGHILTNDHVVRDVLTRHAVEWVSVVFKSASDQQLDRSGIVPARVVDRDPKRDLALVKLAEPPPPHAAVLPLAPKPAVIAEQVLAVGHPLGWSWYFTTGTVGLVDHLHKWDDRRDKVAREARVFVLDKVAVAQGSSGGAVLDGDGTLLGIIAGGQDGFKFAIDQREVEGYLLSRLKK